MTDKGTRNVARWADRHGWMPLLRGTDGLTGRERRRMARHYLQTIGRRDEQMTFALRQAIRAATSNRACPCGGSGQGGGCSCDPPFLGKAQR